MKILRIDIFEEATPAYPVVRHEFIGQTKEECVGYYHAHLKSDAFLRGCMEGQRYDGIVCRSEVNWV